MSSSTSPETRRRLPEITSGVEYASRALKEIARVGSCVDDATVIEVLHDAKSALEVDHACFVSFVRDDDSKESFRFLVACDPTWCLEYQRQGWYSGDAWLLYAATNSEPISASQIPLRTKSQRQAAALAAEHGMRSTYVVPAPASSGLSRLGVLVLGSEQSRFFDTDAVAPLKALARSLAMELHEWWVRQVRREIIATHRITHEDLHLLSRERAGMSTKEIAEELGTTVSAIDSRFHRLSTKFNTPNRRATARLAAEYGLI